MPVVHSRPDAPHTSRMSPILASEMIMLFASAVLASVMLLEPVGASGTEASEPSVPAAEDSRSLVSSSFRGTVNACNVVCQQMTNSQGVPITYFCVLVEAPYGEGEDCWASVEECSLRTSTACLGNGGGGGSGEELAAEVLVVAADGRPLASATLCAVDQRPIAIELMDFQHARQRAALRRAAEIE